MRLSTHQKNFVYELLAIGTRPCQIVKKVNKLFEGEVALKPFGSNNLAFYQNQFKKLEPKEQMEYLPYTLEQSFAQQLTRINDDIKDLERLNEKIDEAEENKENKKIDTTDILDIIALKAKIKNRIAQELGQALAWTKGGPGTNINMLQMVQNNFNQIVNTASKLKPEEKLELLRKIGQLEEASEQSRPEVNP